MFPIDFSQAITLSKLQMADPLALQRFPQIIEGYRLREIVGRQSHTLHHILLPVPGGQHNHGYICSTRELFEIFQDLEAVGAGHHYFSRMRSGFSETAAAQADLPSAAWIT